MKFILQFLLHITLLSSLALALSPTPKPTPIPCPHEYKPVCGSTGGYKNGVTFRNICELESMNITSKGAVLIHEGKCNPSDTEDKALTYSQNPTELLCDYEYFNGHFIQALASPIKYNTEYYRDNVFLSISQDMHSKNYIKLNTHSIQLVDEEGNYVSSVYKESDGAWEVDTYNGNIIFTPNNNFNNNAEIKYVINNVCDKNSTLSFPNLIRVVMAPRMEHNNTIPIIDTVCRSSTPESFNYRYYSRFIDKNKALDTIPISAPFISHASDSKIAPGSLRLVDKDNKIVRRIHKKDFGTWLADTTTGSVLFVPDANMEGSKSVRYIFRDVCHGYQVENTGHISIVAPTPTPTPTPAPCPQTKEPVCGQENLCMVQPSGDTICLASIPRNTTYTNMCELFRAGDVFLYAGACHTPTPTPTPQIIYIEVTPTPKPTPTITPTPTPKPTPKATPKPKPVTATEEPKPTTNTTVTPETNTTQVTPTVQSSDGSAFGSLSLLGLMMLTGMIAFFGMRREEI